MLNRAVVVVVAVAVLIVGPLQASAKKKKFFGLYPLGHTTGISRFSDEPVPYQSVGEIPARPRLMLELGDPFLETGNLFPGFLLPGGAVWQPRLWVYNIFRTAVQTFDNGTRERETEWANRLDTYINLQLTGTEKILLGFRPLDNNRATEFSRITWEGDEVPGGRGEFNANLRALFFEGDLGSLFPFLDRKGMRPIDLGFSVGRQQIIFQDGILINDELDALGLIRNNIPFPGTSNLRMTGVWAWNGSDRGDNRGDPQTDMLALFTSADTHVRTLNLDMAYVFNGRPDGDGFYIGGSTIQRIGYFNTNFRINASSARGKDTPQVADGVLLSSEFSWTPHSSDDIVYINPFWALGTFTQAGREPIVGGPLAALGILFASPNLGNHLSELSPAASEVAGAAIGYQAFWNDHHTNLTLEMAGRKDTEREGLDSGAVGFQLQQKIGRHVQVQLDGFFAVQESRDDAFGARSEIQIIF